MPGAPYRPPGFRASDPMDDVVISANVQEKRTEQLRYMPLDQMPKWKGGELDTLEHCHAMLNCHTTKCAQFERGHCEKHKPMICFDYHFDSQKRRPVVNADNQLLYWDVPCEFISRPASCPQGADCRFAHSKDEVSYHPAKYRTRMCNGKECRKEACCFAHSEEELRTRNAYIYRTPWKANSREENKNTSTDPFQGMVCPPVSNPSSDVDPNLSTTLSDVPDISYQVFDFKTFKTQPCSCKHPSHDRKVCILYHSIRDRRRPNFEDYTAEQCPDHFDLDTSVIRCKKGDDCNMCHNRLELLYHPDVFKQRFCSSYPNVKRCLRGQFCAFAHTRSEVTAKLFDEENKKSKSVDFYVKNFKTLWCPYGVQHDWHRCIYAHTYQDFRRVPDIGYGSEPCPFWDKNQALSDYEHRCPLGFQCPYSHGSKEQLYHPAYYKTNPCVDWKSSKRCPRGWLCAFYHDAEERRAIPTKKFDYAKSLPDKCIEVFKKIQPAYNRPPLFNQDDDEDDDALPTANAGRVPAAKPPTRFAAPAPTHETNVNNKTPDPRSMEASMYGHNMSSMYGHPSFESPNPYKMEGGESMAHLRPEFSTPYPPYMGGRPVETTPLPCLPGDGPAAAYWQGRSAPGTPETVDYSNKISEMEKTMQSIMSSTQRSLTAQQAAHASLAEQRSHEAARSGAASDFSRPPPGLDQDLAAAEHERAAMMHQQQGSMPPYHPGMANPWMGYDPMAMGGPPMYPGMYGGHGMYGAGAGATR